MKITGTVAPDEIRWAKRTGRFLEDLDGEYQPIVFASQDDMNGMQELNDRLGSEIHLTPIRVWNAGQNSFSAKFWPLSTN